MRYFNTRNAISVAKKFLNNLHLYSCFFEIAYNLKAEFKRPFIYTSKVAVFHFLGKL